MSPESEPLTTGDWIRLLHDRLRTLEDSRSEMVRRALTLAGVFIVASGIVFGFLDLTSLSLLEIRAVASLWLLVGFASVLILFLFGQRSAQLAMKASIEEIVELGKVTSPVLFTLGALMLSGMVMGVVLLGGVYFARASLQDFATIALVLLAEILGLILAVFPFTLPRAARSEKVRQAWTKLQAASAGGSTHKNGARALEIVCGLGVILAAWSFGYTLGLSQLGIRGAIQIVGAGYVAYGSLVGIAFCMKYAAGVVTYMANARKLLYEALETGLSAADLRARYTALLRASYELNDLIMKYYKS